MNTVYLRFVTEKWSLESLAIRFATRSWASHVGFLRLENGVPVDTLDSRIKGGVQIRPYGYDKVSAESWFTAPNIEAAYNYGKTLIGCKYDWLDILGIGFNTPWHKDGNYICSAFVDHCGKVASPMRWTGSELVAEIYKSTGQGWLNDKFPSRLVTPRDLLASPAIVRVRRVKG
jgi:hypothetical protein